MSKSTILKCIIKYFSSIFTRLCNYHHYLIPEHFHHPRLIFYLKKYFCFAMTPERDSSTDRIMHPSPSPPPPCLHLIPRACKHVRLGCMKRKFRLQMKLRLLINWIWNGEIIPGYVHGASVITRILNSKRGNQRSLCQSQRRRCNGGSRGQNVAIADLKMAGEARS